MKHGTNRRWPGRTRGALLLGAALALGLLSGCGILYPERAEDGTAWDRSWEMMGSVLGVEPPGNGFSLLENDVVLAADDTYYASWTAGEAAPYVNAAGREVDLYPAQLYLLLYGCGDGDSAAAAAADFLDRERETYEITGEETVTVNGVSYTLLRYDCVSADNPYQRGVSAFGVWRRYAVAAELTLTAEDGRDAYAALTEFLAGCHYSAEHLR